MYPEVFGKEQMLGTVAEKIVISNLKLKTNQSRLFDNEISRGAVTRRVIGGWGIFVFGPTDLARRG